jgi:hypothetical protein
MRVTSIVIGVSLLFSSVLAQAEVFADGSGIEKSNYVGVMVASPQYQDESHGDFRGPGLIVRGGRDFFKYFAVEGHLGVFSGDEVDNNSYKIDYMASLFARGNIYLFDDRARAYLMLGGTYFSADLPRFKSENDSSLAYGLGLELYGNSRNALTLEYVRYADSDIHNVDYDINSFSLGYLHRF